MGVISDAIDSLQEWCENLFKDGIKSQFDSISDLMTETFHKTTEGLYLRLCHRGIWYRHSAAALAPAELSALYRGLCGAAGDLLYHLRFPADRLTVRASQRTGAALCHGRHSRHADPVYL